MVKVAWGGVKDEPTCICIRTILILPESGFSEKTSSAPVVPPRRIPDRW